MCCFVCPGVKEGHHDSGIHRERPDVGKSSSAFFCGIVFFFFAGLCAPGQTSDQGFAESGETPPAELHPLK